MVKAVLGKKKGPGRGSGKGGNADPTGERALAKVLELAGRVCDESALPRAHALLDRLSAIDLHGVIPVLEKHALPEEIGPDETRPRVPFSAFAEDIATIDALIDVRKYDVAHPSACDLAIFIHNFGNNTERAEALLGVMPVATRLFRRLDDAEETAAEAVKGKKQ